MALHAPRGTTDLIGRSAEAWHFMQQAAIDCFATYGYKLIETPTFEQLDVFVRGIGEATDVVGKEMFLVHSKHTLEKMAAGEPLKAEEQLALRPEMTAGVARAIVENNLVPPDSATAKFVYAASMYRHERPQKGRLREFHQIGAECVGAAEPSADAEIIIMLMQFFEGIGIPRDKMRLLVNSMGDDNCRPQYRQQVREFIMANAAGLCPDCVRRADTNPLRAFDCKNADCQAVLKDAPKITDVLCDECDAHYQSVKALLDASGVAYIEDPRLVRGLDYYTRTVFEVQVNEGLGSQSAIGGGGRYDKLIEEFGGKPTPGLGFAIGYERILMAIDAAGTYQFATYDMDVYIAAVDDSTRDAAFALALELRSAGISAELDHQKRSLKSQFKQADRSGAPFIIVVGPDELANGEVKLRSMATREETSVPIKEVTATVKAQLLLV
jgi:histidyl-tRNA synthetase